jgi:hypothetical protein
VPESLFELADIVVGVVLALSPGDFDVADTSVE